MWQKRTSLIVLCTSIIVYFNLICINIFFHFIFNLYNTTIISSKNESWHYPLKQDRQCCLLWRNQRGWRKLQLDLQNFSQNIRHSTIFKQVQLSQRNIQMTFFNNLVQWPCHYPPSWTVHFHIKTENIQTKHPVCETRFFILILTLKSNHWITCGNKYNDEHELKPTGFFSRPSLHACGFWLADRDSDFSVLCPISHYPHMQFLLRNIYLPVS